MSVYREFGGREACKRLAVAFYARVAQDPVLRPLFPGKSFTCAIEEFAAYLAQLLDGPPEDAARRWWLSLRESHARFQIGNAERQAWLQNMAIALGEVEELSPQHREALRSLFGEASAYLVNSGPQPAETCPVATGLASRWKAQQLLDQAVAHLREGRLQQSLRLAEGAVLRERFGHNRSLYASFLGELLSSGQGEAFVLEALADDPNLAQQRYAGKTLLHTASAAGCGGVVTLLLTQSADVNAKDQGGHTPLYSLANECRTGGGEVARLLIEHGAQVDACEGVKRCTPLHMAARRGNVEVGAVLIDHGANIEARDSNGDTPLRRAVNCGQVDFASMLLQRRADPISLGSRGLTPALAARSASMRALFAAGSQSG